MRIPGFTVRHRTADGREYIAASAAPDGGSGGNMRDGGSGGNTPVDLDKLRSIRPGSRTRPQVREGRRADGVRVKATTDELGHTVTEHASEDDRVDVLIRAETVKARPSR